MSLKDSTIRNFANMIKDDTTSDLKPQILYGTVKKTDSETYVILDGSNIETPVITAMDAENGDRVMVSIINHTATITGNISSPASARTASSYMKLTDEGLIIGRLNNGQPIGSYCLIGLKNEDKVRFSDDTEFYYIMNPDGSVAARFGDDIIDLGITPEAIISLCSGRAIFRSFQEYSYNDEPGPVTVELSTIAKNAAERSTLSMYAKHLYNPQYSEMMSDTPYYGDAKVSVQNNTGANRGTINPSIELKVRRGIDVETDEPTSSYGSSSIQIMDGRIDMYADNIESTIFKNKSVKVTDSIAANTSKTLSVTVSIDSGYTLIGISGVINNHNTICHLTQFYKSGNELYVTFYNHNSSDLNMDITIQYLLIKSSVNHLT